MPRTTGASSPGGKLKSPRKNERELADGGGVEGERRIRRSFSFQAGDGIGELVRSRGLGDVCERQGDNPQTTITTNNDKQQAGHHLSPIHI